jgi:hypothetical protein
MFIRKWLLFRGVLNHGFLGLQDFTDCSVKLRFWESIMFIRKWLLYRGVLNHGFLGLQDFTDYSVKLRFGMTQIL